MPGPRRPRRRLEGGRSWWRCASSSRRSSTRGSPPTASRLWERRGTRRCGASARAYRALSSRSARTGCSAGGGTPTRCARSPRMARRDGRRGPTTLASTAGYRREATRWALNDAPGRVVERLVPHPVRVSVVVVHAPHHVAAVAAYVDVLRLGREDQCIQGEVRLQEPTVRLRLYHRQLYFLRRDAEVQPRGHLRYLDLGVRTEQQLRDDLLHPGRAGLGVGRDDAVVVAEAEIVPDHRVEVVVVLLSGLCWTSNRLGHSSSCSRLPCHLFRRKRLASVQHRRHERPRRPAFVCVSITDAYFVSCRLARLSLRRPVCGSTHGLFSHTTPTVPPQSSNVTIGAL